MPSASPYTAEEDAALIKELWSPAIADDLVAFVKFVYPWGKVGTQLEHVKGPRKWQIEILQQITEYLKSGSKGDLPSMFKLAVTSGRGVGKSAVVGWLSHWFMSTRVGGTNTVTANTEPQLKSKTIPEISKWFNMAINSHWFDVQATSIKPAPWFAELMSKSTDQGGLLRDPKYFYTQAQLWSEENPDAFAGAHNPLGEMYIFDEASGIPQCIWTVTQGVFTEQIIDRYWFVFSNPRRNTGAFFECFHKNREQWRTEQIDARTVEGIAQDTFKSIIEEHGIDSDQAKIEVYGVFPNAGQRQFIPMDIINNAVARDVYIDVGAPLVMGVDVARFGEDRSVIAFRKGRDARSIPWLTFRKMDTAHLSAQIAHYAEKYRVDAIFIDGGGVGGGVVDQLKAMKYRVIEVQAGESAENKDKYLNKRAEMWDRLSEWLVTGSIDKDKDLENDLKGPEYDYHPTTGQLRIERKDEMKKRGLASPDMAEALMQTFSRPVARLDTSVSRNRREPRMALGMDEPIFG